MQQVELGQKMVFTRAIVIFSSIVSNSEKQIC